MTTTRPTGAVQRAEAPQLSLLEPQPEAKTPALRPRQAAVLAALQAAGEAGLEASEAGAVAHELKQGRWTHGREQRCKFCAEEGMDVLRALERKGLARYVRGRQLWYAVAEPQAEVEVGFPPDFEGLRGEYNAFPAAY